jgi:hypothetical protein
MGIRPNASQIRVLKKLIVLTHPTLAATSPTRPESAGAASSAKGTTHPGKAAGESKPEAYQSPARPELPRQLVSRVDWLRISMSRERR